MRLPVFFFIVCSVLSAICFTQVLQLTYAEELADSSAQASHDVWHPVLRENDHNPSHDDREWYHKCYSELYAIMECGMKSYKSGHRIHVDDKCCSALKKFVSLCSSKSGRFERMLHSFSWMRHGCAHHHQSDSPSPSAPKTPTPNPPKTPSPTPTPTAPKTPPPTPSAPKTPTPSPPSSSSGQSTPPASVFDPPEALPLPMVYGGSSGEGCWSSSGDSSMCWAGKGNVTEHCCTLSRSIGKYCNGKNGQYDEKEENCCLTYKDGSNECKLVTPRYYNQN